eukprot:2398458-Prymnesium_polylepis.1
MFQPPKTPAGFLSRTCQKVGTGWNSWNSPYVLRRNPVPTLFQPVPTLFQPAVPTCCANPPFHTPESHAPPRPPARSTLGSHCR